jgi:hypothetical protein
MRSDPKLSTELVLAAVELMGRVGRDGTVRVEGESMRPALRPGQRLAVDFAPERLARGDVLVFRQGDALLVHRMLWRSRALEGRVRLRTRGDGVPDLDPPVDLDRVVGRVVAFEDDGSWRSARSRLARIYAWSVALHDIVWAGLGSLFRRVDHRLGRWRIPWRFRPWVRVVDRGALRWVHRLLFERMHPRVSLPETDAGATPGGPSEV